MNNAFGSKYCLNCKYLSLREYEQVNKKEDHICLYYMKRVHHLGHHPELVRLSECKIIRKEISE